MEKKKVLLITYGNRDHASTRIRALNHFERLKDIFDTTWVPRVKEDKRNGLLNTIIFAISKRLQQLKLILAVLTYGFDIAFIQVMFLPEWLLRSLKKKGTLICFDFDDAVYMYSKTKFDTMMQYTDKVIVASPYLLEYIKPYHKDCQVIFSPVNTGQILPAKNIQAVFTIGWIGSQWTLPYLETLIPVFEQLANKISFRLLIVGAELRVPGVEIECIPWSEENEIDTLGKIDVGIMPLKDDEWSKMKGGYKLFLYMAAGLPTVASPSGINSSIVKENFSGYLAESSEQWLNAFLQLNADKKLRIQLGSNARKDVEQNYSYQVCTQKLRNFLIN